MTMVKPAYWERLSLESLRLEAECLQLAGAVAQPDLRLHFMRMARAWNRRASGAAAEPDAATASVAGRGAR
ncbi:MAG: hypothetical protein Q8M24_23345 [Pseudolabrys sp.]|nr:hypothetical protein [Pseudolabrys sp.]MDP2298389.1 hypothetical protein [Pseudolabrys sp.]